MKLFSDLYCDDVIITNKLYEKFHEKFAKTNYYDENKINDLIYFAYEMHEEMEFTITKRKLLLTLADIVNVIPIDLVMELKHFELKRLLNASKDNYLDVYSKISSDHTGKFDQYYG